MLPYRTPVVAAKEMATLDWLSRGRFFPAVGVGVELPREFEASGVPFKERGRRTDEAIHVIRLLWTEDEVSFQGEFYKLDRVTIFPKPWQTPPPIWIGGKSDAAIRRTARVGDGWMPSFITPDEFRAGAERVKELAPRGRARGAGGPLRHPHQLRRRRHRRGRPVAMAEPYIQRGRVDDSRDEAVHGLRARSTSVIAKIEEYVKGGASKFILRPLCPPDRMLEQLADPRRARRAGVSLPLTRPAGVRPGSSPPVRGITGGFHSPRVDRRMRRVACRPCPGGEIR